MTIVQTVPGLFCHFVPSEVAKEVTKKGKPKSQEIADWVKGKTLESINKQSIELFSFSLARKKDKNKQESKKRIVWDEYVCKETCLYFISDRFPSSYYFFERKKITKLKQWSVE